MREIEILDESIRSKRPTKDRFIYFLKGFGEVARLNFELEGHGGFDWESSIAAAS